MPPGADKFHAAPRHPYQFQSWMCIAVNFGVIFAIIFIGVNINVRFPIVEYHYQKIIIIVDYSYGATRLEFKKQN